MANNVGLTGGSRASRSQVRQSAAREKRMFDRITGHTRFRKWFSRVGQGVAAAVSVVSLVFAYMSLPARPPSMVVEKHSSIDLIGVTTALSNLHGLPLEITWRDQVGLEPPTRVSLSRLYHEVLRIRNPGDTALESSSDMAEPVQFKLEGEGVILSVRAPQVLHSDSSLGSEVYLAADRKSFEWRSPRIPPGAYLGLQVLHNGSGASITVRGRVKRQPPLEIDARPAAALLKGKGKLYRSTKEFSLVLGFVGGVGVLLFDKRRGRPWGESVLRANAVAVIPAIMGMWVLLGIIYLSPVYGDRAIAQFLGLQAVIVAIACMVLWRDELVGPKRSVPRGDGIEG
jgi:hypothetical protein